MAKRKKILFVVEAMGGGVFTYIVDLANELVNEYDMYIFYATRPQTPADYKDYFDQKIHLIESKSFTRYINPLKDIGAIAEVKSIAKKIKLDLIHLHSSKAGVIGRIAFSGGTVPLFYTPHGYSFLMENYNPVRREIFRLIELAMAKRRCTTISCSLGEQLETIKLTKRAVFVNNGINTKSFDRMLNNNIKKEPHPFTVFTLGRICYQKNPALFNTIAESLPNVNFLWIGDGELRSTLTAKNIEITGWIERNVALEKAYNADVFILTSLWEGMPISLLEAMYMKKLCIVSDVIGNRDVIKDGVNGFVCHTVEEFSNAIETKDYADIIMNARKDIEQTYNTSVMFEKYKEIYEKAFSN